jgi:hypothetical protein
MRPIVGGVFLAVTAGFIGAAAAADGNTFGLTEREGFLATAIAAMIGCGLFSFGLAGRASRRTQVALALLVVLIGGFSLLVLFGLAERETPLLGAIVLVLLIGLFKLMNQFEIQRRLPPEPPARLANTTRPGRDRHTAAG